MRNYSRVRGSILLLVALVVLATPALARSLRINPIPMDDTDARPPVSRLLHNLNMTWSAVMNLGLFGDYQGNFPSMEWPGGTGNSYLWAGDLWSCCYGPVTIWGDSTAKWASCAQSAQSYELWASDGFPAEKLVPGPTALEQTQYGYDDWNPSRNTDPYGMMVWDENYTWGTPGYNEFMANYFVITHQSAQGNPGVPLEGFLMAIRADADVATADASACNEDDLVYYDGHEIWCNDPNATFDYQFDNGTTASTADAFTYQQNAVGFAEEIDNVYYYYNYLGGDGIVDADVDGNGVSDHFTILAKVVGSDTIYTAEPNTGLFLFDSGMPENHWNHVVGDTTYLVVPRNTSYIWDGDNPASGDDDTGEPVLDPCCNGFIGWRLLDFWVKKANGTIERPIDIYGVPIPISHSWWNIETDPGSDIEIYDYMWGQNPDASGQVSGPAYLADWVGNPNAPEAYVPENPGPWPIVHNLPIAMGYPQFDYRFLLSAGPVTLADGDSLFVVGGWLVARGLDGLRVSADALLDAYYRDGGWGVPSLPPTPILFYEAQDHNVHLEWGDNAEAYDPFGGYRIYRATFEPSGWELIADIPGTGTHSYDDGEVTNGFPYYYVVCSYDAETGIESTKSNYKQTLEGTPISVVPTWDADANWTEEVAVVPNPYRGSAAWEQTYFDKIAFINLPAMCDIYIYTLAGDHVITLEHRGWAGEEGTEFWDLVSRNNQEVVSGLYFYRVENEDDSVIGKFAIIK